MSRALATALALGLLSASHASACPCQGSTGPGGAVTRRGDTWGASVAETVRTVHGAFRSNGDYASLDGQRAARAIDIAALVGVRPVRAVEVSLESAVGHQSFSSPEVSSTRTGFGDVLLRGRWEALGEPLPFVRTALPWPSVTIALALRAPLASNTSLSRSGFSGTTGSVGTAASSEGLGAWEAAGGLVLARSFGRRWQGTAIAEGAYRFPDGTLGMSRHLPVRVFGQLGLRYMPSDTIGVGLLGDYGTEGDVVLRGSAQAGTAQHLWAVSCYSFVKTGEAGLRWGALVRWVPPLDGAGRNAIAATSFGVSLGTAR